MWPTAKLIFNWFFVLETYLSLRFIWLFHASSGHAATKIGYWYQLCRKTHFGRKFAWSTKSRKTPPVDVDIDDFWAIPLLKTPAAIYNPVFKTSHKKYTLRWEHAQFLAAIRRLYFNNKFIQRVSENLCVSLKAARAHAIHIQSKQKLSC